MRRYPVEVIEYDENTGELTLTPAFTIPPGLALAVVNVDTAETFPATVLEDGRVTATVGHWSGYCLADQ